MLSDCGGRGLQPDPPSPTGVNLLPPPPPPPPPPHGVGFIKNFESTAVLMQILLKHKFSCVNVYCEDVVLACQSLKKDMFKSI